MAWKLLPRYLAGCTENLQACTSDPALQNLIKQIAAKRTSSQPNLLRFASGRANPDLFTAGNETHRMAVTRLSPDSEIYLNTDVIDSVAVEEAVGLLAHEVTHHLGIKDDEKRLPDRVASALRAFMVASTETWSWKLEGSATPLRVSLHNPPRPSTKAAGVADDPERMNFPAVWVEADSKLWELSNVWVGMPFCPYGTEDLGWVRYEGARKNDQASESNARRFAARIEMKASSVCLMNDGRKLNFDSSMGAIVTIDAMKDGNGWELSNRTRIEFLLDDVSSTLASLTKLKTSSTKIKNGDSLNIEAEIRSRLPLEDFCSVDIGSDEFRWKRPSGALLSFPLAGDNCVIKKLDANRYSLKATFKAPLTTPSRTYKILRLRPYSTEVGNHGGFVEILPQETTSFRVESAKEGRDPEIVSWGLELGSDNGLEKTGVRNILWCQRFLFVLRMKETEGYLFRTGEIGFDVERVRNSPTPYFSEPDDRFRYIDIHEGFTFIPQMEEKKDASGALRTHFAMRFAEEFTFPPEVAQSLVFRDFVFLTKELREVRLDFPSLELKMAPPKIHPYCGF